MTTTEFSSTHKCNLIRENVIKKKKKTKKHNQNRRDLEPLGL